MTWTAPEITRTKPPLVADEHGPLVGDQRTMLQTWLDLHRRCCGSAPGSRPNS